MDFSDSLDLCLSCGNHVADGTAYCSNRCLSLDRSARRNLNHHPSRRSPSSSNPRASSSSSQRSQPRSGGRRPLLDYQASSNSQRTPSSYDLNAYEEEPYFLEDDSDSVHAQQKLASIAEWAEGVWGGAPSDTEEDCTTRRAPRPSMALPTKMERRLVVVPILPPHSSPKSKVTHRRRPQFTLSAALVAPPAMSITTSMDDDTSSSIMTPSSSSASPRVITTHKRKPSDGSAIDPFIASPPYEFAYNHGTNVHQIPEQQQQPVIAIRGRTLARV